MLTGNEFRLLIRAVEPARGAGEDKVRRRERHARGEANHMCTIL